VTYQLVYNFLLDSKFLDDLNHKKVILKLKIFSKEALLSSESDQINCRGIVQQSGWHTRFDTRCKHAKRCRDFGAHSKPHKEQDNFSEKK